MPHVDHWPSTLIINQKPHYMTQNAYAQGTNNSLHGYIPKVTHVDF